MLPSRNSTPTGGAAAWPDQPILQRLAAGLPSSCITAIDFDSDRNKLRGTETLDFYSNELRSAFVQFRLAVGTSQRASGRVERGEAPHPRFAARFMPPHRACPSALPVEHFVLVLFLLYCYSEQYPVEHAWTRTDRAATRNPDVY